MVEVIKAVSVIILLVSIIYSFIVKVIIMNLKIRKYEGETEGTIKSVRESYIKCNFYYYYPTYRYIVDDVIYEEELAFYENRKENLPIGEVRMLKYDKENPKNFFPIINKRALLLRTYKYILMAVCIIAIYLYNGW